VVKPLWSPADIARRLVRFRRRMGTPTMRRFTVVGYSPDRFWHALWDAAKSSAIPATSWWNTRPYAGSLVSPRTVNCAESLLRRVTRRCVIYRDESES
jgi:hypothetical protein